MPRIVHVRAPSRLHFGLMSFGHEATRQYGGVGVMIDDPHVELLIQPSEQLLVSGMLAERVDKFARNALKHWKLNNSPRCKINVLATPPEHHGLGCGTQLALSVAAGIRAFLELPSLSESRLAESVGRGRRSSVGVHGFFHGGLIYEAGHALGESLGPLVDHVPLPEEWRFLLIRAPGPVGQSGEKETGAFANLPPVPLCVTKRLDTLANEHLVSAARTAAFDAFSKSVYEYGRLAGECFTTCQGGPFASSTIEELVEMLRGWGVHGVGQSSWGPTVFALCRDNTHAIEIQTRLLAMPAWKSCEVRTTAPCNVGAQIGGSDSFLRSVGW